MFPSPSEGSQAEGETVRNEQIIPLEGPGKAPGKGRKGNTIPKLASTHMLELNKRLTGTLFTKVARACRLSGEGASIEEPTPICTRHKGTFHCTSILAEARGRGRMETWKCRLQPGLGSHSGLLAASIPWGLRNQELLST